MAFKSWRQHRAKVGASLTLFACSQHAPVSEQATAPNADAGPASSDAPLGTDVSSAPTEVVAPNTLDVPATSEVTAAASTELSLSSASQPSDASTTATLSSSAPSDDRTSGNTEANSSDVTAPSQTDAGATSDVTSDDSTSAQLDTSSLSTGHTDSSEANTDDAPSQECRPGKYLADAEGASECWPCAPGTLADDTRCLVPEVCTWDEVAVSTEVGVACEPGPNWRVVGGPDHDTGSMIRATPDGNVQVLMQANRTVTFDQTGSMLQFAQVPAQKPVTLTDLGIVVTSEWGTIAFTNPLSETQTATVTGRDVLAIAADADGNVYRAATRDQRWHLERLTPDGVRIWQRSFAYEGTIDGTKLAQRGNFVAFCAELPSPEVRLLDTSGNQIWRTSAPASSRFDACGDIELDAMGNVWLLENTNTNPTLTKWDFAGVELWQKSFPQGMAVVAMASDGESNLVIAGNYYGPWVQKVDATGEPRWIWPPNDFRDVGISDVAADANGDWWLTGSRMGDLLVVHLDADLSDTATCDPGSYAASSEVGASCESWADCQEDEYAASTPGPFEDRQCASCPLGMTSDLEYCNSSGCCFDRRVCPPGTHVVTPGSETNDAECEPCAVGSYAAVVNAPECLPCEPGTTSHGLESECHPVLNCSGGDAGDADARVADAGVADAGDAPVTCELSVAQWVYRSSGNSLAIDDEGGLYVAESFYGADAVRHMDASGNTTWLWRSETAGVPAIYYDPLTDTLYVGVCGQNACRVVRLDATGNVVSDWPLDSATPSSISALLVDEQRRVYVAGAASIDGSSGSDAFIKQLDETGVEQWTHWNRPILSMGSYDQYSFLQLGRDAAGNVYGLMTGADPMWRAPYMFGVHKLTNEGTEIWQHTVDPSLPMPPFTFWSVQPSDMEVTSAGDVYVAVGVEGIAKFDTDGHLAWNAEFAPPHPQPVDIWGVEHTASTTITKVAVDVDGRVWALGVSDGVVDGETIPKNGGPILLRLNTADGTIEEARRVPASEALVPATKPPACVIPILDAFWW